MSAYAWCPVERRWRYIGHPCRATRSALESRTDVVGMTDAGRFPPREPTRSPVAVAYKPAGVFPPASRRA